MDHMNVYGIKNF